jgi:hypothetical protein
MVIGGFDLHQRLGGDYGNQLRADREFLINNFSDNDANGMGTG